jgi:hypothetical protein
MGTISIFFSRFGFFAPWHNKDSMNGSIFLTRVLYFIAEVTDTVDEFLGVSYALPPTQHRRFKVSVSASASVEQLYNVVQSASSFDLAVEGSVQRHFPPPCVSPGCASVQQNAEKLSG